MRSRRGARRLAETDLMEEAEKQDAEVVTGSGLDGRGGGSDDAKGVQRAGARQS